MPGVTCGFSHTQDLGTFLMALFMAIQQHGASEVLVTDGGSIFRVKQLATLLDRLWVQKYGIARRQAWQNYVEALFGVQRRMADRRFAYAGSWSELLVVHDQWVADYNYCSPNHQSQKPPFLRHSKKTRFVHRLTQEHMIQNPFRNQDVATCDHLYVLRR